MTEKEMQDKLIDTMPAMYARPFMRSDIDTYEDLASAIKELGLNGKGNSFQLKGKHIDGAGKKIWTLTLSELYARGFDWVQHADFPFNRLDPFAEELKDLQASVNRLSAVLESFLKNKKGQE